MNSKNFIKFPTVEFESLGLEGDFDTGMGSLPVSIHARRQAPLDRSVISLKY
jgi:hypothetical protein